MRISNRARSALATVAAATLIVTGAVFASPAAIAAITPPAVVKIAALGDSITLATSSCSSFSSCVANSWSTGTTASVGSHATRLKATAGVTSVTSFNNAVNGTKVGALNTQAAKAVTQGANYVTIEIGANDACTSTVATMTSADAFRAGIRGTLTTLAAPGANAPQVFLASIPNLYRMYELNKGSSSARLTWGLLRICQSMLANPTSVKPADLQRRIDVQTRVDQYNAILAEECAAFASICRFDGGAVANYAFAKTDISTRDYFHPSLAGQTKLAAITWAKTQWAL
jgi:hypothetical protein